MPSSAALCLALRASKQCHQSLVFRGTIGESSCAVSVIARFISVLGLKHPLAFQAYDTAPAVCDQDFHARTGLSACHCISPRSFLRISSESFLSNTTCPTCSNTPHGAQALSLRIWPTQKHSPMIRSSRSLRRGPMHRILTMRRKRNSFGRWIGSSYRP